MTDRDNELLSSYLDGELPSAEARQLRERLLAEPCLREAYEQMRAVDERIRRGLDLPGVDVVPANVVRMVENAGVPAGRNLAARRVGVGVALAASVLAAAGLLFEPWQETGGEPDRMPLASAQDALLSPLLETVPAAGEGWIAMADGERFRPVLSFPGADGNWCREYLLASADSTSRGVACRSGGQWQTRVVVREAGVANEALYRPAGAAAADEVAAFIDRHAADIPLSPAREAELIDRSWQ